MSTYRFPDVHVESFPYKNGWLFENVETKQQCVFEDSVYNDGDEFYKLKILGNCNLPWQTEFPDFWQIVIMTYPCQIYTFAKTEEELKERLAYIAETGHTVIESPVKYRQITKTYGIDNRRIRGESSIVKLIEGYDKVITEVYFTPKKLVSFTSPETVLTDKFDLNRSHDILYNFENVDYFTTQIKPDVKIPGNTFTEETPWIPKMGAYNILTVHRKDQSKPVKFVACMVNMDNSQYEYLKNRNGVRFPNIEYSHGLLVQ